MLIVANRNKIAVKSQRKLPVVYVGDFKSHMKSPQKSHQKSLVQTGLKMQKRFQRETMFLIVLVVPAQKVKVKTVCFLSTFKNCSHKTHIHVYSRLSSIMSVNPAIFQFSFFPFMVWNCKRYPICYTYAWNDHLDRNL